MMKYATASLAEIWVESIRSTTEIVALQYKTASMQFVHFVMTVLISSLSAASVKQ